MASGLYLSLLLKGIVIGFVIAAPVGPVNILCIHRTLAVGRRSGMISGLGAAAADTVFGVIAALGLTLIADFLVSQQTWMRLIGGIVLVILGTRALVYPPQTFADIERRWHKRMAGDFTSTFALTITNPVTIFSFAAIFAAANAVVPDGDYDAALMLIGGVFAGSLLWWTGLTFGTGMFRHRFTEDSLIRLSRISGVLIVACGVIALFSVVPPFSGIFVY